MPSSTKLPLIKCSWSLRICALIIDPALGEHCAGATTPSFCFLPSTISLETVQLVRQRRQHWIALLIETNLFISAQRQSPNSMTCNQNASQAIQFSDFVRHCSSAWTTKQDAIYRHTFSCLFTCAAVCSKKTIYCIFIYMPWDGARPPGRSTWFSGMYWHLRNLFQVCWVQPCGAARKVQLRDAAHSIPATLLSLNAGWKIVEIIILKLPVRFVKNSIMLISRVQSYNTDVYRSC